MFKVQIQELEDKAYRIRRDLIELMYRSGSGHLDTSLSLVEIWLALVYSDFFQYDANDGAWDGRDPVFLSEGHACPVQYLVNADLGFYTVEDVFSGFRKPWSPFQGHTRRNLKHGLENSNGSLGIGLWQAYGYALETDRFVFCIAGDGEFQEPSSQSLLSAPHFLKPAPNLILILNDNKLAQDDAVDLGPVEGVAELYNWQVIHVSNSHNYKELGEAYLNAIEDRERPSFIVCETVKGKGGDPVNEGVLGFHGRPPKDETEYRAYIAGLEATRRA